MTVDVRYHLVTTVDDLFYSALRRCKTVSRQERHCSPTNAFCSVGVLNTGIYTWCHSRSDCINFTVLFSSTRPQFQPPLLYQRLTLADRKASTMPSKSSKAVETTLIVSEAVLSALNDAAGFAPVPLLKEAAGSALKILQAVQASLSLPMIPKLSLM